MRDALSGHLPALDPLSPRAAFEQLSPLIRPIVCYDALAAWEADTRTLPRPLRALRRRLRRFAETHLAPAALEADAAPHPPVGTTPPAARAVLEAAGRAGLLSDMLPAPLGDADPLSFVYPLSMLASLKTEELAAADGGLMLLVCAHALGVAPVVLSGDLGLVRRHLLPAFRASKRGEPHVFAFAITEPHAGSDVEEGHGASTQKPGTVARRVPGGFLLRGRKCFISGGDIARDVVVFAALEGEGIASWTAFLVDASARGYAVPRTEHKMGMRASGAAEIELDDVFVPDARVVGGLRRGWALNRATLNMSRLPVAAMGVGFARAATDAAIRFCAQHRLGKKRLLDYQDVQLTLADMVAETQAGRAMVWTAAKRVQILQREASAAKFFCTDMAIRAAWRAMDLLGNHALARDAGVEKVWRDARLTQIFEGTNQINRLGVIEDMQEEIFGTLRESAEENGENGEGHST